MVSDANFFDLTENQRKQLGQAFEKVDRPDGALLGQLAKLTGLNVPIVKAWFQNERKKARKKLLEVQKRREKLAKSGKQQEKATISDSSYSDLSYQGSSSSGEANSSSEEETSQSSGDSSAEEEEEQEKMAQKREMERKEEVRGKSLTERQKALLRDFFEKNPGIVPNSDILEQMASQMGVKGRLIREWHEQNWGPKRLVPSAPSYAKTSSPVPTAPSTSAAAMQNNQQVRQVARRLFPQQQMGPGPKGKPSNGADGLLKRRMFIGIWLFTCFCLLLLMTWLVPRQHQMDNSRLVRRKNGSSSKYQGMDKTSDCVGHGMGQGEEEGALFESGLDILPLEHAVQIGPMSLRDILDGSELCLSKEEEAEFAGFSWQLTAQKREAKLTGTNLLFLVLQAQPNYPPPLTAQYNISADVDFKVDFEENGTDAENPFTCRRILAHQDSRQCVFNSNRGGKCGLLISSFEERTLRLVELAGKEKELDHFIGKTSAYFKADFRLNIPSTQAAIERL